MVKGERRAPINCEIAPGLMRFSRARMYQKRGVYKKKPFPVAKKEKATKESHVIKKVGGDNNGQERKVLKQKPQRLLPPTKLVKKQKRGKKVPRTKLRPTLTPGTVVILLAGRHKGKRCVFLRQLESGLLLVTGPLKLNNCPLRRVAQCYVIGTKTKLDLSEVNIAEHLNDQYFKRQRRAKRSAKKEDTELFATKSQAYEVSDQRKSDQQEVDKQILGVIRKQPEKKLLFGYLGSSFSLRKNQYPHQMVF